ncbi:hypothetical protein PMI42_00749 [Bradyrhizobium sp. YR681]|uniref:hypothetical protein n=1 Tax=Bradyrhizobium sp. YR681 TaxID=1144344 RepID=UPI000270E6A9|nr:hypothetical protein [Bradyrhizobium sp. YR681]EJN15731.1 hypothetical protein PMI42_00749 [Bradyrhizobium sp. YR681]
MTKLHWQEGAYPGDNRRLLMCGTVAVGAIFLPGPRARYTRWRAWCTARMNAAEGTERNPDQARTEVEKRFTEFLHLAGLAPAEPRDDA